MSKIMFYVNIALVISVVILSYWLSNVIKEKDRLNDNQTALLSDIQFYKTETGKNAASVQKLELTKSELEEHCQDLTKTVEDLGIKVKRLQSATTTISKTELEIKTIVRDSIVYRDRPISLKVISWMDPWVSLNGVLDGEEFSAKIESIDSLSHVVHRVPKKFLFFRYGVKAVKLDVVTKNPHSRIIYTKYIELH